MEKEIKDMSKTQLLRQLKKIDRLDKKSSKMYDQLMKQSEEYKIEKEELDFDEAKPLDDIVEMLRSGGIALELVSKYQQAMQNSCKNDELHQKIYNSEKIADWIIGVKKPLYHFFRKQIATELIGRTASMGFNAMSKLTGMPYEPHNNGQSE